MPELPLGAVIAFDFEKWNVQEEIALVRAAGARRIQVYRNYLRGAEAERIRSTLQDAGLLIDSLHGYINLEQFEGPAFDLSSPDADVREASMELARAEADFARRLGCRDVIVHPVGPGETENDAGRPAALRRSAEELVRIAERADVRFLLENMPPPMFGRDARFLRDVADTLDSTRFGLAYDSGHATLAGRPVETIHEMGPRLWGVHLHDNDGREDDHRLPGMGVVPFEDVARALAEVKFAGTFMLEIYRDTAEVRRDLTPERLAYIERLRHIASGLGA
ncbi:MAG: sugar phosphate isomerase/epimerase [Planctomycetota bacterium]|nr:sugar phosphate isomerase/epimerase [Planctomycetota bacterium]